MKVRYASDLHLEFDQRFMELERSVGEDVFVLAGDIENGSYGVKWARAMITERPVIYVLGNHELYHGHWDKVLEECLQAAAGSHVHVLEREGVVIGGYRFLGTTLWTDFNGWGPDRAAESIQAAGERMNDFHIVWKGNRAAPSVLRPEDTIERYHGNVAWLNQEIAASKQPVVVVTHHGPSMKGCPPQYQGDILTPAFLSDAEWLVRPPVRGWIYGHTHYSTEFQVNGIPVVTNQAGYPRERGRHFDPAAMLELPPP